MSEFRLIDAVVRALEDTADGLEVGPGDDCSVSALGDADIELVSSIDTLIVGRHFPVGAPAMDVGYRSMMVALSDLAAMGAEPQFVLVAVTLASADEPWLVDLARGMRDAARTCGAKVAGGNLARGPLSITLSVHGFVPKGEAVLRSGARPGDRVYVSGPLGGAAAALEEGFTDAARARRYYRPAARLDLSAALRSQASAAIDLSDGLLQDAAHVAKASRVAIDLVSREIPLFDGARLEHGLRGGDDYEICFTAPEPPAFPAQQIGTVVEGSGVRLDGEPVVANGYQHFASL